MGWVRELDESLRKINIIADKPYYSRQREDLIEHVKSLSAIINGNISPFSAILNELFEDDAVDKSSKEPRIDLSKMHEENINDYEGVINYTFDDVKRAINRAIEEFGELNEHEHSLVTLIEVFLKYPEKLNKR